GRAALGAVGHPDDVLVPAGVLPALPTPSARHPDVGPLDPPRGARPHPPPRPGGGVGRAGSRRPTSGGPAPPGGPRAGGGASVRRRASRTLWVSGFSQ